MGGRATTGVVKGSSAVWLGGAVVAVGGVGWLVWGGESADEAHGAPDAGAPTFAEPTPAAAEPDGGAAPAALDEREMEELEALVERLAGSAGEGAAGEPSGPAGEAPGQLPGQLPGEAPDERAADPAATAEAASGDLGAATEGPPNETPEARAQRLWGVYVRRQNSHALSERLLGQIAPAIEEARAAGDAERLERLEETERRLRLRRDNLARAIEAMGDVQRP